MMNQKFNIKKLRKYMNTLLKNKIMLTIMMYFLYTVSSQTPSIHPVYYDLELSKFKKTYIVSYQFLDNKTK